MTNRGATSGTVGSIGCTSATHLVAAQASRDAVPAEARRSTQQADSGGQRQRVVVAAIDRIRDRHVDRSGDGNDAATDGDAVAGRQRLEHDPIQVAVAHQLAATDIAEPTHVARGVGKLETGEDHFEATGLQLFAGVDDVERESAGGQLCVGQRVREQVTVLAGDGAVGVADANARARPHVGDRGLVGRVGRRHHHIDGLAEVVGDDALVAVPLGGTEVLVDRLAEPHTITCRCDQHLFCIEALVVHATTHHAGQHQRRPGDQ